MKKKYALLAIVIVASLILILQVFPFTYAAQTKTKILSFTKMSEHIEKNLGTVFEMELSLRNGKPVYKADVLIDDKITPIYFNAQTGAEIERKSADTPDKEETSIISGYSFDAASVTAAPPKTQQKSSNAKAASPSSNKITNEKAKQIALEKVGGGVVKDIDLDYENGRLVYEMEVLYNNTEYDIDVDAETGKIVKFKMDD